MKAITAMERAADKVVVDGIKSLILTYQQTKLAGDVGGRTTWADFSKMMVRAALRRDRRGNIGFTGDISNIGQTP